MCDHHPVSAAPARRGSRLEHGAAHAAEHRLWSRRGFLASLGALSAGAFTVGASPLRVFGGSPFSRQLDAIAPNRILVLIQLRGGNDGLNTIVPYNDDRYYTMRPAIAIPREEALALSLTDQLGMHPSLAPLESHFGNGDMAVVQQVGYPDFTLSHFRSTDIWLSASDADRIEGTGWLGRYLQAENPGFDLNPPDNPLAVQIGGSVAQMFKGPTADMGMMLTSTKVLDRLVADGEVYNTSAVPATTYGEEMAFARLVANNSFRYAGAVSEAYDRGSNSITYPDIEGKLASNLATVARLIDGGLGARIYHVSLIGFDTHANQTNQHANLLDMLARSIDVFMQDVANLEGDHEVLAMTYSEFGRRVPQNGSKGTDHGTAAPVLLFGKGLNGGVYGGPPDLANLDSGNMAFETDFRSVYGTILQRWFGINRNQTQEALLGFNYASLDLFSEPLAIGGPGGEQPDGFELGQNYPNPFASATTISFSLREAGPVTVDVYDIQGRVVAALVDRTLPAGEHRVTFDAAGLPSGTYLYRIRTGAGEQTRTMVRMR
ncbi:MAG: DUF1501 domain-containing protein [Rhodothermales bacterium]